MLRAVALTVPMTAAALALVFAAPVSASDTKAALAEIEAHDKAFLAAYENGETKKMKAEVGKAIALGEKNGLSTDPVMADTYVLAAILEIEGNENSKAGVRELVKALKIKPDVAIPKGMATSPVKAALKEARAELGQTPKADAPKGPTAPSAAAIASDKPASEPANDQGKDLRTEKGPPPAPPVAAKAADRKQEKELEARIQQLEKDKADRDRQLADAKARIQQLEKDKADRDRQLADLQRQRADQDKQLAASRAEESKQREALDKITRDKQAAEAEARDAENRRQQAQQERERLFAGPEMPAHLREALTCEVPDEAPLRSDLFVHCVARPNLKARSIVFYYRTGSAHYYSVPMERTTKGWYAAIVPGARVVGKVLQYYAEALDGREAVVANNGKETSPNILTLRPGAPRS